MIQKTMLSTKISVTDYTEMTAMQDRQAIAHFLRNRLQERYIDPVKHSGVFKNGFAIMAMACLLIEALESFAQGWENTRARGRSEEAFRLFFQRFPAFSDFVPLAADFYRGVRCGLLHQAETTDGWHIRRIGKLYDGRTKTINASKFLSEIENALAIYCSQLETSGWDSEVWQRLRKKMDSLCQTSPAT